MSIKFPSGFEKVTNFDIYILDSARARILIINHRQISKFVTVAESKLIIRSIRHIGCGFQLSSHFGRLIVLS